MFQAQCLPGRPSRIRPRDEGLGTFLLIAFAMGAVGCGRLGYEPLVTTGGDDGGADAIVGDGPGATVMMEDAVASADAMDGPTGQGADGLVADGSLDRQPDLTPPSDGGSTGQGADGLVTDGSLDRQPDITPPSGNGRACSGAGQCGSGFCVDGLCCESSCTQLCASCAIPGSLGRCTMVAAGDDPDNECLSDGVSTCGQDGTCNGAGTCRRFAANTVCAAPICTAGVATTERTCDGAGTCRPAPQTILCVQYACAPTACKNICVGPTDCASGYVCDATVCVKKF